MARLWDVVSMLGDVAAIGDVTGWWPSYGMRYSCWEQGFGAGAARSRGIWLEPEPEPTLWPGSGSTLNICIIIYANYMELYLI